MEIKCNEKSLECTMKNSIEKGLYNFEEFGRAICELYDEINKLKENKIKVPFRKTTPLAILPQYQRGGDACFDFYALIEDESSFVEIKPGYQEIVGTGVCAAIPEGFEIQIRPRSGLSAKMQLTVTNSPGTIDSAYRNEFKILLLNLGHDTIIINNGDRIAQGKLSKVYEADIFEVQEFTEEEIKQDRGGGFGSTGIK
ncbi:MAG: dUTP diphosphatase [Clostridia bacterium]